MSGAVPFPRQYQADLLARFPTYEIWYVPLALGGFTWCARRRDETNLLNTLHADNPGELADMIEQELAERAEHDNAADAFRPTPVTRIDHPGD